MQGHHGGRSIRILRQENPEVVHVWVLVVSLAVMLSISLDSCEHLPSDAPILFALPTETFTNVKKEKALHILFSPQ